MKILLDRDSVAKGMASHNLQVVLLMPVAGIHSGLEDWDLFVLFCYVACGRQESFAPILVMKAS